jgi:dTDP-4-amino-4,6-dideoxygalactose transaminase
MGAPGMNNLAFTGGAKAVANQLPGWPLFDYKAISVVTEVLKSGTVKHSSARRRMEFAKKCAACLGSKSTISGATGIAALHVALSAVATARGNEVILPSTE